MANLKDVVEVTLSADAGIGGTFTVSYPSYRSALSYNGATDHEIHSNSVRALRAADGDFSVAMGASNMTVSLLRGGSFVEGATIFLHLERAQVATVLGEDVEFANEANMDAVSLVRISLGSPATADADGAVASQAATAAGGLATGINGALASGGVATFATPRNVVAAWTNTAVLTVTGTDEYGEVVKESSASGTSLTGKKAFKTITGVSVSADVTGLTVGSGNVLGLPTYLGQTGDVVKEIFDGAAVTNGTFVAGVTSTATATTGDVRGTYAPNSAPNGSRTYEVIAAFRNPSYKGVDQFSG